MITCVGESIEDELKATLAETSDFSILSDGSTDSGVIEQELFYVLYRMRWPYIGQNYLKMASVSDGTAEGLTRLLLDAVAGVGLDDTSKHTMVGFGADGASVNMGKKKGVAARLRVDKPWLVTVHCSNHRLKLTVKYVFAGSYYTEVFDTFTQIYYRFNNSSKRLHELAALAAAMEAHVVKPCKAHGTHWVQHNVAALAAAMEAHVMKPCNAHGTCWMQHNVAAATAILRSYDVLITHLESMSADPTHGQAKSKGHLNTKMTTFKFVVHLVFNVDLLRTTTVEAVSCLVEGCNRDPPHARCRTCHEVGSLARLRAAEDEETALSKLVKMGASGTASYKGVSLTRVEMS